VPEGVRLVHDDARHEHHGNCFVRVCDVLVLEDKLLQEAIIVLRVDSLEHIHLL
jgi:hypothetical protein